jgi:hypothetical protein
VGVRSIPGFEFEESTFTLARKCTITAVSCVSGQDLTVEQFRFFRALGSGILLNRRARRLLRPHHILLPTISTTWAPLMEIDFNLHKSNSTYFTDLDMSRAFLSGVIFGPLITGSGSKRCNLIVGAVSCTFKREIKPYKTYETWTRVASWDEKWIYMVTHFVQRGELRAGQRVLQSHSSECAGEKPETASRSEGCRVVFASAVTRFVCKRGRLTVPPAHALEECGLLRVSTRPFSLSIGETGLQLEEHLNADSAATPDSATAASSTMLEDVESSRIANLPIVRLQQGWDKVHELFREDIAVLGTYSDMVWR